MVRPPRRGINPKCVSQNNRDAKYVKQKLIYLKGEIGKSILTFGDFSTPLSVTFITTRQKTSKVTEELKSAINQQDLIDIYRTFHNRTEEYILFTNIHGTYTNIHILFHKTNFNNFKRIHIMQNMSSDHNGINPEIIEKNNTKISKY